MSHVKTDKLSARTASGTITLGESGETITVPSGVVLTNNGTASGFGKVLQVVSADYSTSNSTSNTSYVTAVTGSITTSVASSKIEIIASFGWNTANANSFIKYERTISGSTTAIYTSSSWVLRNNNAGLVDMVVPINFLDTPSQSAGTTITYTISVNRGSGSGTVITNESYVARIQLMEIAG